MASHISGELHWSLPPPSVRREKGGKEARGLGPRHSAARRRRAPARASARAGEGAGGGAAASFPGSMAAAVSWREKTERENEPRVCGRRVVAEFCSREKSARPSDLDRRQRTAGNGGRRTGQMWSKREIIAGRFGGPGPRCGLGAGAPRACWQAGRLLGRRGVLPPAQKGKCAHSARQCGHRANFWSGPFKQ